MTTPNPVEQIMQVTTGYIASSALYVAMNLNIPDHLAKGPKSAEQLAKDTGAKSDALNRVLRLLASLGLFEQVKPGTYGLTPASQMLRKDAPGSMRGMALFLPDPMHL